METDSLDGSEDFVADQDEVDDETTMAQEESLPIVMAVDEEIQMLKDENELSVEELRRKYTAALGVTEYANEPEATDADNPVKSSTEKSLDDMLEVDDAGEEDEFCPAAGADVDDETTFEAEERLGRDMSYEAEISLLENESEIPIEQLRAMYASMNNTASEDEVMDSEEETPDNGGDGEVHGASTLHELATAQTDDMEEEEFEPNDQDAVDDETTMEVEERLCRDMSYGDEIALLKRESEMSFEKLRSLYAGIDEVEELDEFDNEGISQPSSLSVLAGTVEDQENDGDFCPEVDEQDDETTMETEERLGREMSAEAELAMLKEQSEIPVEALRKMHQVNDEDNEEESESEESSLAKRKREAEPAGLNAKRIRHDTEEDDTSDGGKAAFDALEASAERAQKTVASRPYILSPWVKLREYQQIGLNWLVSLQSRRLNGILADEMGLGKTLQTISLLSYLAAYKGIWGPHLIVVPTSVIVNWETELKRFAPALKVLCYYGSAKRRKELRTGWTKSNWYHVVITSYQLAVQDAFAFKRKRWYYLVLDEAHNIKNFQSQRWQTLISFNSQRRLLLTGTPLQNNLMELWSLLHFLMPYIFRSRKEFSYWFSNPMNDMIEGNNQNDEVINRLHGLIRPFVLRRLKKDVETQMPGKYEHIIKCQLSRRQVRIAIGVVWLELVPFFIRSNCLSLRAADVHLRRIHGSIYYPTGNQEGRQLYGDDECVDAASKGLQPPGSL
jgi:SNF2 family DNA or RNA helicase